MIGLGLSLPAVAARSLGGAGAPPEAPAITYRGAGADTQGTTTTVYPLVETAQAGDLLVMCVTTFGTFSSAPGTTAVGASTSSEGFRYKVAVGGETSLTFNNTSAQTQRGFVMSFRPTGGTISLATSSDTTGTPPAAINLAQTPVSVAVLYGRHISTSTTAWTVSAPVGFVTVGALPYAAGPPVRPATFGGYSIFTVGTTTGNHQAAPAGISTRNVLAVFRLTPA